MIYDLETTKEEVHHSNYRDEKVIVDAIKSLQNKFVAFQNVTNNYLQQKSLNDFDDVNYDTVFERFIEDVRRFEQELNDIFFGVANEFISFKRNVYLLIALLIVLTVLINYYYIYHENKNFEYHTKQEKLIESQYKLAAMGEMIDAIAHQWKAPLGIIKMHAQMLEFEAEQKELTDELIKESSDSTIAQVEHLVNTLDEFRKFFRPNTTLEIVSLKNMIDTTLLLLKDELVNNTIEVINNVDKDITYSLNQNEFKHVLINLIQNSRDAFNEKDIQNRKIIFDATKTKDTITLQICDNAAGVPIDIIDKIFIPHFTTKEKGKGTGIGLYLTKQIVEKHHATITAQNVNDGVCFTILLPV